MKLNLSAQGLLDPRQLTAWTQRQRQALQAAVARGLDKGRNTVVEAARREMRRAFAVKRPSFVRSMTTRLYDRKPDRFPALRIGSRIPWLGVHGEGGILSGNMLIPLLPNRIGPRRFRAVITALMRSGNAYFVRRNGRTLLFAENLPDNASVLSRFKRAARAHSGQKRLRRGQEIPIALLVRRVRLRRRFDLAAAVRGALPALAHAINAELQRIR